MKKLFVIVLVLSMMLSLAACGSKSASESAAPAQEAAPAQAAEPAPEKTAEPTPEPTQDPDDLIDDPAWDELKAQGKTYVSDGKTLAKITLPAQYSEGATQEAVDNSAGEVYTSGIINEDGSITYEVTKAQHKFMCDSMMEVVDQTFTQIEEAADYSFTKIEHNTDYTVYDVTLNKNEVTEADTILSAVFKMCSEMYGIFSEHTYDDIVINYYGPDGALIDTLHSAG